MSSDQDVGEQLRLLREDYARQLPDKLAQLEQSLHAGPDSDRLSSLRFLAHGLAGSGTTFGFPEVSEAARRLEVMVELALEAQRHLTEAELATVATLFERLHRAALRPAAKMPSQAQPRTHALGVEKKQIYLVEDDTQLAADLALQLGQFGYQVTVFETPERLFETAADPALAVVLMDIVFPQGELAGAQAIMERSAAQALEAPVVFMSVRNDLPARLAAVRAGARAYIVKPVDVAALVGTLDELTSDRPVEPFRVLIMDDTELLAQHHAYVLKKAGMLTEVVTDPMRILAHLADFKPDLVLMDMYMPGCTGAELASVIRQMENYVSVPIVFLSTESDANKQRMAIERGGDDFLTKPIAPEQLVFAVSVRLRRYRVLRVHMLRDSLTGLLNHATTKEYLALEIERAARQKHVFCFAMIDLDHFKTVNDTYGHLVGDRVLRSLADLFKKRLRKTDITGRVGGEEFAVILPNTRSADAVGRMDKLREAFSEMLQHAGSSEFTVTFSCGIAEYPIGESADGVIALADGAMYQAKQAGRNRVVSSATRTS